MRHEPLKEGKTPTEFLTAWSNAFSLCVKEEKNADLRIKYDRLMITCDETLNCLHNISPQTWRNSEIIEALNVFIEHFQKGVIETGGNAWEAQRRINMIREIIGLIREKKPKAVVGQTSLF